MALVLERRASKDEILELYLNEVSLGQRGSFAIHGVAEGARLFFGKDVSNLTLAEAATIAGVIQSPYGLSPFTTPQRARERRNVVLQAMADARLHRRRTRPRRASQEPLAVVPRALDAEAPYFVDMIGQTLAEQYPGPDARPRGGRRLHDARPAPAAPRAGRRPRRARPASTSCCSRRKRQGPAAGGADRRRSADRRDPRVRRRPLVQPVAVQPRRHRRAASPARCSSRSSTSPRSSRPPPRAAPTSRRPRSSIDEPTTFEFDDQAWTPENYEDEYDGPITLRRALAHSRNVATVKVAEMAGFDTVAALVEAARRRRRRRSRIRRSRSASFEATPFEIATAYTVFPNLGAAPPAARHPADHTRRQAGAPSRRGRAADRSRGPTRRSSSPT